MAKIQVHETYFIDKDNRTLAFELDAKGQKVRVELSSFSKEVDLNNPKNLHDLKVVLQDTALIAARTLELSLKVGALIGLEAGHSFREQLDRLQSGWYDFVTFWQQTQQGARPDEGTTQP